jgi:hypothetical protein
MVPGAVWCPVSEVGHNLKEKRNNRTHGKSRKARNGIWISRSTLPCFSVCSVVSLVLRLLNRLLRSLLETKVRDPELRDFDLLLIQAGNNPERAIPLERLWVLKARVLSNSRASYFSSTEAKRKRACKRPTVSAE